MKVIFNYATRQFEPMEPTLRDRFMLGGRVELKMGGKPDYTPLPIELIEIDNSPILGGRGTKMSTLTPNGQNLLTNFRNMIEYYNNNSIPVPSKNDIFYEAGGKNLPVKNPKNFYRNAGSNFFKGEGKLFKEAADTIIPTVDKIDNYVNNVMLNPETNWRTVAFPGKHIQEKFGVSKDFIARAKKNGLIPSLTDKDNKKLFDLLSSPTFNASQGAGSRLKTIEDVINFSEIRIPTSILKSNRRTPGVLIMEYALRNHVNSVRAGVPPQVKFIGNPIYMDQKDLKFIYKGQTYQLNPNMEFLTSREISKNAAPDSARKINALQVQSGNELKLLRKNFPEVYKVYEDLDTYKNTKVGNKTLTRIAQEQKYKTNKNKSVFFKSDVDIDHKSGVIDKPFEDLRLLDKETNQKAGLINREFNAGRIDEATRNKQLSDIGYDKDYKDINEFIENRKKSLKVDVPNLKQAPSKIKTALKAAKPVLKALPVIGTGIGLYDVNKALQAGITDPRDLYTAYEVSPEIAAKQKTMREDPTGKLLKEEITNLPEITTDDQVAGALMDSFPNQSFLQYQSAVDDGFQGSFEEYLQQQSMKMARGGRVGFANGSPSPLESEATIDQALAALNSSEVRKQFLYDTSPIGKLDKNIFGKDGDRNLMQQFNTQFLDPRSYPYYAQKTIRGAANIPELAVRFPLAAAYLFGKGSLALQTGDLSKFSMEDLRTAMEILEPKFTKLALDGTLGDVLGLSPEAIQAVEEKRAPSQKATGDLLQFGAEAVGPATPYFAVKALQKIFPKLPQQIKDLVGSTTAIDKVNKEIEKRTAVEGVDQTRRDIILATGAGGAVALLKLLGLDNLFKAAPKAVKAAPEIITKGGTPKYFFDFVGLIKSKGKDITDTAAVTERQKVYDYNGYTVYENLDTGRITIAKDTEGGGSYYIGDGEYETIEGIIRKEEIVYDPPETILDDAGKPKRVPDNYEENTLKPDADGGDGDVEAGLESIDEILELLAKDGKKYSLDELIKMGISPDGIGDDLLLKILKDPTELKIDKIKTKGDKKMDEIRERIKSKIERAGGGIIKLAGDDSGPPPKSGPTPHGLPYVAKNVRPIKERK